MGSEFVLEEKFSITLKLDHISGGKRTDHLLVFDKFYIKSNLLFDVITNYRLYGIPETS